MQSRKDGNRSLKFEEVFRTHLIGSMRHGCVEVTYFRASWVFICKYVGSQAFILVLCVLGYIRSLLWVLGMV